jgi:hypothetical protein
MRIWSTPILGQTGKLCAMYALKKRRQYFIGNVRAVANSYGRKCYADVIIAFLH